MAGQRPVSFPALRPSGRPKWVRAPARKTRLAANGKPNALLAPPGGGKWSLNPSAKTQPGGFKIRPAGAILMVFQFSGQPICSQKRYMITANWARVAVPVGFRVPSEVPVTMLLATDHCMGSTA